MRELKAELAGLPSNRLRKKQLQLEKSRPVHEVRGKGEDIDKDTGICEDDGLDRMMMSLSQAEREAYEKAPVLAGAFFEVAEEESTETHIVLADENDDGETSFYV